jgi:ankyrin repeat protein
MLLLQIIASKSRMSVESVRTPDPSLTIRKPVQKTERIKNLFFNLIELANTEEDYTALEQLLNKHEYLSNASDEEGITALMIASEMNNIRIVRLLIEKGANKDIRDKNGMSAFLYARGNNDLHRKMRNLLRTNESTKPSRPKPNGKRPTGSKPTGPRPTGGARTRRRSRKSNETRKR